jgi:hypothetical protein
LLLRLGVGWVAHLSHVDLTTLTGHACVFLVLSIVGQLREAGGRGKSNIYAPSVVSLYGIQTDYITLHYMDPKLVKMTGGGGISHTITLRISAAELFITVLNEENLCRIVVNFFTN